MAAIKPIRSKRESAAALSRLEKVWPKNEKFSSQATHDEFEILTLVIEDYENFLLKGKPSFLNSKETKDEAITRTGIESLHYVLQSNE